MGPLRRFMDRLEPLFVKGGRFERFNAVYEMIDTGLYTPSDVTRNAPHVRDALDLKRVMIYVLFASAPAAVIGLYNVGLQANTAIYAMELTEMTGWRPALLAASGIGFSPDSFWACFIHGLLYFLPIYLVTMAVGGIWEVLFAAVRNHEVNEGFLVTSWLFALILPPTIPLWQVALGVSFGTVVGKEIFGGTGKNFLNPALVGRAFLFFAYPSQISGNVWVPVDGYSGATPLAMAAEGGVQGMVDGGVTWMQAFIGTVPGSLGETSALACLLGAVFLVYARIASWRIMLGVVLGLFFMTALFNLVGSDTNPMFGVPWHWHLVIGSAAFGLVFMATDPVSASMTETGRWIYGALIGVMIVLIRVVNPAYPEGVMLAILFGNVFAPVIDWFVVRANVRRRMRRNA
ncbi:MAG: NADH:ubiquinone reductase (Na(+)-transporting) subunit B [Gammaproteobacteria bacterium]|nr:NADH:ubiquinone reductase (Na(+)-transporting) subunit B [Gammaproteobacteria bacterium]